MAGALAALEGQGAIDWRADVAVCQLLPPSKVDDGAPNSLIGWALRNIDPQRLPHLIYHILPRREERQKRLRQPVRFPWVTRQVMRALYNSLPALHSGPPMG